jgi:hypothetical protein
MIAPLQIEQKRTGKNAGHNRTQGTIGHNNRYNPTYIASHLIGIQIDHFCRFTVGMTVNRQQHLLSCRFTVVPTAN